MKDDMDRREFVRLGLMVTAALSIMGCDFFLEPEEMQKEKTSPEQEKEELKDGEEPGEKDKKETTEEEEKKKAKDENEEDPLIPRRKLGSTGLSVSIFSLGGAFTVSRGDMRREAAELINHALDSGVNYIDTAPTYAESESNIGEVMQTRRDETFLASKTLERTYDGAMRQIEGSLKNLKTDYLDIYQLHGVHAEDDLKELFGRKGAVKALEELKENGVIGFTGITGHKNYPVFLQAMEEYNFDIALIPLNPGEIHTDSFARNVLPVALEKNMGIIAMKIAAYGRIFQQNGINTMEEALGYVLTYPVNTSIIGISNIDELRENIEIARKFAPLSLERMQYLEDLAAPYKREANFFKFEW